MQIKKLSNGSLLIDNNKYVNPTAQVRIDPHNPNNVIIFDPLYKKIIIDYREVTNITFTSAVELFEYVYKVFDNPETNISQLQKKIENGLFFFYRNVIELPSHGEIKMLLINGASQINIITDLACSDRLYADLYTNPTITDNGFQLPLINRNENSTKTTDVQIFSDTQASVNGILVNRKLVGFDKNRGSQNRDEKAMILAPNSVKLLVFTNKVNVKVWVEYFVSFYYGD